MDLSELGIVLETRYIPEWFVENHLKAVTERFLSWWISSHGLPSKYPPGIEDQTKYYEYMAYALQGWNVSQKAQFNDDQSLLNFVRDVADLNVSRKGYYKDAEGFDQNPGIKLNEFNRRAKTLLMRLGAGKTR